MTVQQLLSHALMKKHLMSETGDLYISRRIKKEPVYEAVMKFCLHQIGHATSNIERMQLVKPLLSSLVDKEFDEQVANMKPKDADISELLRQQGNEEYQKKNFTKAHELYTQSIAAAPMTSNQLALGFANRSAVLRAMRKFSESLADIQRALDLDYPECQRYKLFLRQAQSYRDLGDEKNAAVSFSIAKINVALLRDMTHAEKVRLIEDLIKPEQKAEKVKPASKEVLYERPPPTVSFGQNKEAPSFSSAVDIQVCEEFGRKVVANRDIKIGDVLLVEKFFGSIIEVEFIPTYCSFCIERCYNLLPCPNCPYAMYCSEECRAEANELYHGEECPALCKLLAVEKTYIMTENARMTTHTIARAGTKNWQKFIAEQATSSTAQKLKGFNSEEKYMPDDLNGLYHLTSKTFTNEMLVSKCLLSLLFMKCFGLENVANFDEVAASFLRLLLSVPLSQFDYIVPELSDERHLLQCNTVRSAAILSLGYSLLNHSCDCNSNYLFTGRHLIVRALKPIKKGDQVTTSYTNAFYEVRKEDRQQNLKFIHNFMCSCMACVYNYPTFGNLPEQPDIMKKYLALRAEILGTARHLENQQQIQGTIAPPLTAGNILMVPFPTYLSVQHSPQAGSALVGNPSRPSKGSDFDKFITNHTSFHPVLYDLVAKLNEEGRTLNQSYIELQSFVIHTFYAESTFYHVGN